jgi:glycosyltransferase involved in cell wall biosynthesis
MQVLQGSDGLLPRAAPRPRLRALRIVTDITGLDRVAGEAMKVRVYPSARYRREWTLRLRLLLAALRSDHLVFNFSSARMLFFVVALAIIPFHRCRLTTLDFFVGPLQGARLRLLRWSLRRVDRLLVHFKDSRIFQSQLGLPASKFRYIPFKINAIDVIQRAVVTDAGYIFCGGRSRRDFATLFAAIEPLGIPVKVVTSNERELNRHGSSLAGLRVPPNVEILPQDESSDFFVRTMAAARLVVIPIVRDSTTQTGIGVYLQAMALGKCTIISTALGVSDVLTGEEAVIVPAGDANALRAAIERAWNDAALRKRYGDAGRRYALPLGGEDQLRRSVLSALP